MVHLPMPAPGCCWPMSHIHPPPLPSPPLPAAGSASEEQLLCGEDRARFCALACMRPMLPRGRFDALVADFAAVARGEATPDVLLAYELPA